MLGLIEYIDRLGAATATAERLAARLSSARDAHSRELLELLATRLHVLAAALDGLDAREASDATVTVRAGKAEDSAACARFVEDLAAMYVGWADGRGMRVRSSGKDGVVVLEVAGLGAYTLLKPESGLHVLELPHERGPRLRSRHRARRRRARRTGRRRSAAVGSARAGDRAAVPARALTPRSLRLRAAHGEDRPRAGRRLRPARRLAARLATTRAFRARAGSRPSRRRGPRPAASRRPSRGRCRACSWRRPRRSRRR